MALDVEAIEEHGLDGHGAQRAGHVRRPRETHASLEPLEARHAARVQRDDLAVDQDAIERERAERRDDLGVASGHDLAAPADEGHRVARALRQDAHAVVLDLEEPVRALGGPRGRGRQHEALLPGRHVPIRRAQVPQPSPECLPHGARVPHLLEREPGADRSGVALGDLLRGDRLASFPDEEPVLALARLAPHSRERPAAPELVAAEVHLEEAALELGARILRLGRPVAPMIPDDDGARAVVVLRDHALELGVLEGVILDLHGQALDLRTDRRALRDGPALEHPVHLQTEVVVEPPGGMLLDDEEAPRPRPPAPEGLRGAVRVALPPVGVQLRRPLVHH